MMKLNYKIYGEGFPIIILHGLLGSLDNWQTVAKSLSQNNMVITLDARNHGRSEQDAIFNYRVMVDDLLNFLEEHHIYKAHFLGHSMGGKTVMSFALENPDFVEKLIVADIAPIVYKSHHQDVFAGLMAVPIDTITSRQEAETILGQFMHENDVIQFLMKGLYRQDDHRFAWRFNLNDIIPQYENILGFENPNQEIFEGETLFIRGSASNYIQDKNWDDIHALFPRAKLETIVNAGHWLHAEKPIEFIDIVSAFLSAAS
jgi:pimeloyl-ACP methyl ester carboxylesterase